VTIIPITFRAACAFVAELHRHNKPPRGLTGRESRGGFHHPPNPTPVSSTA